MSNYVARTAKKTAKKAVRKTTRKVVKGSVNYAKGMVVKGAICWALAAVIGFLPTIGIEVPSMFMGADTVAVAAFIIAGFVCFGRRLTVGRVIALGRTFLN